jgi:hypothetical protein
VGGNDLRPFKVSTDVIVVVVVACSVSFVVSANIPVVTPHDLLVLTFISG